MSDCSLTPSKQICSYVIPRTTYVLMMSALYKTNMLSWIFIVIVPMKQQSAGRHVESGVKHLLLINGLLRSTDPAQA